MINKVSTGKRVFDIFNYIFLIIASIICLFPIINVLAISFSSSASAAAGLVKLRPIDFTLDSYKFALTKPEFIRSFFVSIERVILGCSINMFLTILLAYPLSKDEKEFPMRNIYTWFFLTTVIFSGGLIPWYITIKQLGLIDSIFALVLPGAVPVFNVILLLNFFRGLPKEIHESAFMDGAGHLKTLFWIIVPLSKPAIATIFLFTFVGHWNSWFDGLILMNSPQNYPMQSYLQTIVVNIDFTQLTNASKEQLEMLSRVSDRTLKAAQIFIATLPILVVYPFLQRYFTTGIVLGSVKG